MGYCVRCHTDFPDATRPCPLCGGPGIAFARVPVDHLILLDLQIIKLMGQGGELHHTWTPYTMTCVRDPEGAFVVPIERFDVLRPGMLFQATRAPKPGKTIFCLSVYGALLYGALKIQKKERS